LDSGWVAANLQLFIGTLAIIHIFDCAGQR
jgi:hypothetical protein